MTRGCSIDRDSSRSAFTLMELMVAVAILLGVMVMIGMVFSTATKAGGQATATSTLYRYLGQVSDVIRDDLKRTDPGTGVLGIARVDVRAVDAPNDLTAGYYHRADVLTLFANKSLDPYFLEELSPPISLAQASQVVYGHANFADRDSNGNQIGTVKSVDPGAVNRKSELPASRWHLTRRMVGFPSATDLRAANGKGPTGLSAWLTATQFVESRWELYGDPWDDPLDPNSLKPAIPKGYFEFSGGNLQYYFLEAGLYAYRQNISGNPFMLQGGYWWKGIPGGWDREEGGPILGPVGLPAPAFGDPVFDWVMPARLFYNGPNSRAILDQKPPAGLPQMMAPYFLPGCGEFKVEYTYDDPREIIVDPTTGDPVVDTLTNQPIPRAIRWLTPAPGQTMVWSKLPATSANYGSAPPASIKNRTDPHRWPSALRITMKVWDQGDRLTEPVTRTIIHTWE